MHINVYIYIFTFTELHICSHLHRIPLLLKVPLYRFKISGMIRSAPAHVYVPDTMCTYVQSLLCAVTPVSIINVIQEQKQVELKDPLYKLYKI